MRTVDVKARAICRELGLPDDGTAFGIIKRALKEQDRDTRHACAESVINAADPHAAYMNARAV